jgi:hypothetical protein
VSTEQTGDVVSENSDAEIDPETLARIAARARRVVWKRVRAALDLPAAAHPAPPTASEVGDEQLDRIANEEAERAGGALLHVAVVHAVAEELGIDLQAALEHPAVEPARALLQPGHAAPDADATTDEPLDTSGPEAGLIGAYDESRRPLAPQRALLLDAVHVFGIETLQPGDRDIELRLADVGIDVRKPSTAEMIGRLRWSEIRSVAVQRPRRGLPGRRRPALFIAGTDQGDVTFELPGVSDDEITEHLEPLIARNCAGYSDSNAS